MSLLRQQTKQRYGVGSLAGLRNGDECYCDHGLGPYDIPEDSQASSYKRMLQIVHAYPEATD